MSTLNFRNLTSTPIKITRISRFPSPPTTPKSFADIATLTSTVTSIFRCTPHTAVIPKPPTTAQLAANAQAFESAPASIDIAPYTNHTTTLALNLPNAIHCHAHRFAIAI